jgi:hypothetical protein
MALDLTTKFLQKDDTVLAEHHTTFVLPPELWALVAVFMGEGKQGDVVRKHLTDSVRVMHRDRLGNPRVNGLLHSWYGYEPVVLGEGDLQTSVFYCDGILHRDSDQPAVINAKYSKWYQHGKLHRDFAPAIVYANGRKEWYNHGIWNGSQGPSQ